jgi:hypothetical protein
MIKENYTGVVRLDPSQKFLLHKSVVEQKILLQSPSKVEAIHALGKLIQHNLSTGQKSILVLDKDQNREELIKYLASKKLSKYCLNIPSERNKLSEKENARLKVWCKKTNKQSDGGKLDLYINQANRQKQQLQDAYSKMFKSIFGNQSWIDLVDRNGIISTKFKFAHCIRAIDADLFEFNRNEFWLIKGKVQKLLKHYKPVFKEIEDQYQFHPEAFQQHNATQAYEFISTLYEESQTYLKQLYAFLDTYTYSQEKNWRQKYQIVRDKLNSLYMNLEQFAWYNQRPSLNLSHKIRQAFSSSPTGNTENQSELSALAEEIQELMDQVGVPPSPIPIDSLDIELVETPEFQELLDFWETQLENWDTYKSIAIQKNLNRLNKYNSANDELNTIEQRIEELIKKINEKSLFEDLVEDHALGCKKRIVFLQKLNKRLKDTKGILLQYPAIEHWYNEKLNLPEKMQAVYNMLSYIPADEWMNAIEFWYIRQMVLRNASIEIPQNKRPIDAWFQALQSCRAELERSIDAQWSTKRDEAIEHLKQNNKTIYVNLFKKNHIPEFSWMDLFMADAKSFGDIYPVLIIDTHTLEEFNLLSEQSWDQIIHFQIDDCEAVNQNLSKKLAKKQIVNFNNAYSEKFDLHPKFLGQPKISLLESISSPKQSSHVALGERLQKSRILANHLSQTAGPCRLFQLKNVLLISYLTPIQNQLIISSLDGAGIKELNQADDFELTLQESLLDQNRKWVVFTQDGLMNGKDHAHLEWQLYLLEILAKKGAIMCPIWSIQNIKHWGANIFKYCQDIIAMNEEKELAETAELIN